VKVRPLGWLAVVLLASPLQAQQSTPERLRVLARLPDWTGLWETELSAQLDSGEFARSLGRSFPPRGGEFASPELALFSRMKILGEPPYNAQSARRYRSERGHTTGTHAAQPLVFACSMGFPLILESPVPDGMFQAMVTPEETLFLFQNGEVRHIYTNGRSHPKAEDRWPTSMGDSVGHWEGTTLVIDTIARKAGPIMAGNAPLPGANLSEQAHFIERLRRLDRDTMQDDLTIDDPVRFAHPWRLSFRFQRVMNLDRMIASNCTENDRNPIVDGQFTIAPPRQSHP
jgi:hypothetical protein